MSDVACVCTAPIVGEARLRGLDPQSLVEGLGLSLSEFETKHGRVPWQAFVPFASRATKMLGIDTVEELAASATTDSVPALLARALPRLADSRTLFTLAPRWWGPMIFRGTRGRCEPLPDGRLREIVQILPEFAPCPEFFPGLRGTLRAMPRLLGQADALVSLEHDGREGEFIITPPPRRTRSFWSLRSRGRFGRARLGRSVGRQLADAEHDLEVLAFSEERLLESERRIASMSSKLAEQESRLEVLAYLGKAFAHGGELEAVRQRLARVLRGQLGFDAVRVSQALDDTRATCSPADAAESTSGRVTGPASLFEPLRVADRQIGSVEAWGVRSDQAAAWLHELAPWIALTLEACGSRSLTDQLVELVESDLRDWERMERRLEQLVALQRRGEAETGVGAPDAAGGAGTEQDEDGDASFDPSVAERAIRSATSDFDVVDVAEQIRLLVPHLRRRFGEQAEIELDCTEGLWAGVRDEDDVDDFVESVVAILCDIGSDRIAIESRPIAEAVHLGRGFTSAEVLIRGYGGELGELARARLHDTLERTDTGLLVADMDRPSDDDAAVCVRVCLPLLARSPDGPIH